MIFQKIKKMTFNDYIHLIKIIVALIPGKILKIWEKDIWLISERKNDAKDNGYWLFKYIRKNYPDRKAYYTIDFKSNDYTKVKELGNLIEFGSFRHHLYTWACNKFISAHIGNGFPNGHICFNLLMLKAYSFKNVFLQHGITQSKGAFLLRENNNIDLFCCASKREFEFVKNELGYSEKNLRLVGFCRYDNLDKSELKEKQILIMPTWRYWLVNEFQTIEYQRNNFKESDYYKEYLSLLQDKALNLYLNKNNIKVYFYLHDDMQIYSDLFAVSNKNIVIATKQYFDVQTLLKASNCLITDYSSIAFDFAYMEKPLVYFHFDYEKFRKNQYPEGYFDYESDGFGSVCNNKEMLVNKIIQICDNQFKNEKIYLDRIDEFFYYHDKENCKRNFEEIVKI